MFKMIFLPLNIRDYAFETKGMTAEQCGCYVNLLIKAWGSGGFVPDDDNQLAIIAGVSKARWRKSMRAVMLRLFTVDERGWHHAEMLAALENAQAKIKKNRELAAQGGRATALKRHEMRLAIAAVNNKPESELEREEEKKEKESSFYIGVSNPARAREAEQVDRGTPPLEAMPETPAFNEFVEEEASPNEHVDDDDMFDPLPKSFLPEELEHLRKIRRMRYADTRKALASMQEDLAAEDTARKRARAKSDLPAPNAPTSSMLMQSWE